MKKEKFIVRLPAKGNAIEYRTLNKEYRISNHGNLLRSMVKFDIRYTLFSVRYSFVFLFLFFFSSCYAKTVIPSADSSKYQLIKTLPIEAQFITSDKLAQLYVVTTKNDLIKYNSKGEELFRYTNNTLGELKLVDVTDPFNVLLYYPEFLTVLTLNRTLNLSGEFSLFDLNVVDVPSVAMSNDNNIWLYDDVSFQIIKVDRNGETLENSENLNNQFSKMLQPNFIVERDNWLYVNDSELGILVFDTYGQFSKAIDVKGLLDFQVLDNQLVYRKGEELKSFHLQALNKMVIELPQGISKEHQLSIQRERLFVKKEKGVEIYKY